MPRRTSSLAAPTAHLHGPGKLKVLNGQLAFSTGKGAPLRLDPRQLKELTCYGDVGVTDEAFEPDFAANSYGFRPGRSVPGALAATTKLLTGRPDQNQPLAYVAKLDVADCFGSIDHRQLKETLAAAIDDPPAMEIMDRLLAVGAASVGWLRRRSVGLVQGSSFSPLLCNLVLDPIDQHFVREPWRGQVHLLRYADDMLLLARDKDAARRGVAAIRRGLGGLRLRLKASKCLVGRSEAGVRWLGVEIRPRDDGGQRAEFGYFVPAEKIPHMLARLDEMTVPPSRRIDPAAFDLGRWLASLNEQLREWHNSYCYADNAPVVFRRVDDHVQQRVGNLLATLSGSRRRFVEADYRVRLPRGFCSWQAGGVRLLVLSSLAPRRATYLTHRPAWMRRSRSNWPSASAAARGHADYA
ncbi:MAG: reverse transcriptase domain-containing protein [Candidatus Paceibacterota bacterium]